MNLKHDIRAVARQFQIYGEFLSAEPYGSGHINDTYCAVFDQAGTSTREPATSTAACSSPERARSRIAC